MSPKARSEKERILNAADLRVNLAEAEDLLRAIRNQEVDALVVKSARGDRVYTLETADHAYRRMVEEMQEGAATLTADGRVLYANRHLTEVLGCPVDELIGKPFQAHLAPVDWSRFQALLGAAASGAQAEVSLQTADGTRVPVLLSASRLALDDRELVALLVADLTRHKRADRVARMLGLAKRLACALTPAQVAEAVVAESREALGASAGLVALLSDDGASFTVLHAAGYDRPAGGSPATDVIPAQVGVAIADALRTREMLIRDEPNNHPWLEPDLPAGMAAGEPGPLIAAPLLLADRAIGALQLSFGGRRAFEPEDLDFLLTVAQQCAQALDRSKLISGLERLVLARTAELQGANQRLLEEIDRRRRIQRQLEQWREDERARIAREIHDELGSAVTALKMDLWQAARDEQASPDLRQRLAGLSGEVDAIADLVRQTAQSLRPAILDDMGLLPALEWQFQEFLKRTGLAGEFLCELDDLTLSREAANTCFRIFQEALTNIARHAQARHVVVSVEVRDVRLVLRVTDDGRGLPTDEQALQGHLGLVGMRERADLMSGQLELQSAPGQGTTIQVTLPLGPAGPPG